LTDESSNKEDRMASAELQTVIEMLRTLMPLRNEATIEEMRAGMEAATTAMPPPEDVRFEPVVAGGVPAEWARAPGAVDDRALLYLHGGGYVVGSIRTHRQLVAGISRASGAAVLSLDYRLAPEHPCPAAIEDASAAFRWLLDQGLRPPRLAIGGDSAGGGLTVAALVALRDAGTPLPAAGVCLSPWTDLSMSGASMKSKAAADPLVQSEGILRMATAYLGGRDARSPLASPLFADLQSLPPLLIQVGTAETLLDDSTRLAERARAAGVDVTLETWSDMIHVFQAFAFILPEAREAIDKIGAFLRERWADDA
jgi:acetyl esterase/lipase